MQQRVVLGVLALHADRPMSREQLIDAVWGETAPAYALNLLQKHISGLRRVLEPVRLARSKSQLLAWTDAGYRLSLPDEALDLEIFDRRLGRAQVARTAGDLPGAARALHEALGLWRGPVLDGLSSPLLDAERDRLAERRVSAIEERIDLDMAVGHDGDLVSELHQLVARHPLRERLRALQMRALYRAGRQAEALAAYREAQQFLLDELGVEPAAELQTLHQRMLRGDPELGLPVAETVHLATPEPAPTVPRPAQLPHGMAEFTGRVAELQRLTDLVDHEAAVVIAAIVGTAGVGKTALAVHWAHQVSDRFPDGQLYVNLRGFDPHRNPVEPSNALRGLLEAFAVPAQQIPTGLEDQAALFRSLLAGRRVLVVLDNARDSEQVQPLLPGSPGCLVVVTSRNRLSGLVAGGAVSVSVDLLTAAEAEDFLARRLGAPRVAAEPGAVNDIVRVCTRLPLALAIVAARAAVYPQHSLTALAAELREDGGGLDAFVGESVTSDARAVLSWSYQRLSPPAARLFRLLGLFPGGDLAVPAAASLAGVPRGEARRVLAELSGAHLLEEPSPGRYSFHELLRAYAAEQALAIESPADRHAALGRILDHYLHTAHRAERVLYRYRPAIALDPPDPAAVVLDPVDAGQALCWFLAEQAVLLAAIEHALPAGFPAHASRLAWAVTPFLNYQGKWHDWATSLTTALAAGEQLGDLAGQALTHRLLNLAHLQLELLDQADVHAGRALELFEKLGDVAGQARLHVDYSWVLDRQGDYGAALERSQVARDLFRAAGDRAGEAAALNRVGWFHSRLGRHEQALRYCHESLDMHRALDDHPSQADVWDALGYAHFHSGNYAEAMACYEQALGLWRELGDRYEVATTLLSLAEAQQAVGDTAASHTLFKQSIGIFDEIGHPQAEQLRRRLNLDV
ncbi:BTAD domain-containing putative transcriptional regulator [Actinoplanes sp. NPDC026623]|uniref:AfsR/SARP family transcriptional regulator n=1 Tax=Actinoplanes sp. NPDC026623 TaxID=3155610 RepID=UPI0033C6922F